MRGSQELWTALMFAAARGHVDVVEILMGAGRCELNLRNKARARGQIRCAFVSVIASVYDVV